MSDNKEQIKQKITIELENARLWSTFLIPAFGMGIMFTDQFFHQRLLAKINAGMFTTNWVLFVLYKRNESLKNAYHLISNL